MQIMPTVMASNVSVAAADTGVTVTIWYMWSAGCAGRHGTGPIRQRKYEMKRE